jgi:hypothetical protein
MAIAFAKKGVPQMLEAKSTKETSSQMAKFDQSITVINYILKSKKKRVDEMCLRSDLSETQRIFIGDETKLIQNVEILVKHFKMSLGEVLGKLPPQALELEVTVLGAAILERHAFDTVKKFLLPEHFYKESHKEIWKALLRLENKGIDMASLVVELRRTGQLEGIGGAYYIAELTAGVSSSANIEYHARILVEMAIKREIILSAGVAMHDSFGDAADCFEILETLEGNIRNIRSWIK